MAKFRFQEVDEARANIDKIIQQAVADIVKPYHREIHSIHKDAVKLGSDIERLAASIGGHIAGSVRSEIRLVRKARRRLSAQARKRIGQAQKKRWSEYRRKKKLGSKKTSNKKNAPPAAPKGVPF